MNIQNDTPATALRRRMTEDMTARNLGPHSQRNYLNSCARLAAFLGRSPDTATADDIRRFQLFLIETGASIVPQPDHDRGQVPAAGDAAPARSGGRDLSPLKEPQKIPLVMSRDEVRRLLAMAAKPEGAGDAVAGLWLRAARRRGGPAQGRRHRQRPEHHPHRPVEGAQGPQRDAAGGYPGPAAAVVAERPTRSGCRRRDKAAPLALPGLQAGPAADDRQFLRLFHATVAAAGITKPVTLHCAAPQLRDPSARARHRHPGHPGAARSSQAGDHGALCAGGDRHDRGGGQPAR